MSENCVVDLTLVQVNHALAVLAQHAKALDAQLEDDEDGGVYEDYLVIKSIIGKLEQARETAAEKTDGS